MDEMPSRETASAHRRTTPSEYRHSSSSSSSSSSWMVGALRESSLPRRDTLIVRELAAERLWDSNRGSWLWTEVVSQCVSCVSEKRKRKEEDQELLALHLNAVILFNQEHLPHKHTNTPTGRETAIPHLSTCRVTK